MELLPQLIANGVKAGSVYALVAMGFSLIYGVTRFFNLSHGVMAAVGGYCVFTLVKSAGLNPYAAAVAGVAASGVAGYCVEKALFLRLRKRRASSTAQLVASLGLMSLIQSAIAMIFSSRFESIMPSTDAASVAALGASVTGVQAASFVCAVFVFTGLFVVLKKTRFGKTLRAASDDAEVARIVGIDTDRVTGRVFFIGSASAGLAGVLVGLDVGIEPTMGMGLLLKGVIATIIGGMGLFGSFVGAFVLGIVENLGIWKIPGEWKDTIAFLLLTVFLLFRPQGMMKG